ncbi:MAG TPA: glycosyltransferase family 4 protein [Levilinea sp.]|nr:glycosyltransferase family 4 protein [Levilinea sp.]
MTAQLCILPNLKGMGGPVSFHNRLVAGLKRRGVDVHHNSHHPACATILVIGGTNRLLDLWRAKRRGVRIVQRLNGMNWVHKKRHTGLAHYLRSERNNWVLRYIRRSLADSIVYQSDFARSWWQTVAGTVKAHGRVIYNGVDLNVYHPVGVHDHPKGHQRLLLVEGHLGGGNEQGLDNAVHLMQALNSNGRHIELMVVGDAPPALRARYNILSRSWITWAGVVPSDRIPLIDRSAHLLFSADLNAACPNSTIEALACGLPVIAYATGSLPEIITGDSGIIVPYGSNYWNLEPPDIPALADAARQVLANQVRYRSAARARAEEAFSLDVMVDGYLEVLQS